MYRLMMLRQMMLVLEFSSAEVASEAWLDTALHAFVQVQRFSPLVDLSACVADVWRMRVISVIG